MEWCECDAGRRSLCVFLHSDGEVSTRGLIPFLREEANMKRRVIFMTGEYAAIHDI